MLTEEFNSILAALLIARRYVLTNPEQHASIAYAINIIKRLHYETSREAHAAPPAAPAPVVREPLTTDQVVDAFCKLPHRVQSVAIFQAGVDFAEAHHGIRGAANERHR